MVSSLSIQQEVNPVKAAFASRARSLQAAVLLVVLLTAVPGCASSRPSGMLGPVPTRMPRQAETHEVRCTVTPSAEWAEGWDMKPNVLWVEPATWIALIPRKPRMEGQELVVQLPARPGRLGLGAHLTTGRGSSQMVFAEVDASGACSGIRGYPVAS